MSIKFILGLVTILWVGMILGVGLDNIVKFNAPTLTKTVGFDVGRTVFSAFNHVQAVILLLLCIGMFVANVPQIDKGLILSIGFILLLQVFYLFPALSARVDLLLAGTKPAASFQHALYGMLEILKLALLLALGIKLLI